MAHPTARRGALVCVVAVALVAALMLGACSKGSSKKPKSQATYADRLARGDYEAMDELVKQGTAALPMLQSLLAHENEIVVQNAASVLGSLGQDAAPAADALMAALQRFPKQAYVTQTLKGLKAAAVPSIIRALQGNDPMLKQSAAWLLSGMGDVAAPAVDALIAILQGDDDNATKLEAIGAIGSMKLAAEPAQPFLADIRDAGGPLAEYARRAMRRYESAQAWLAGKEASERERGDR